MCVVEVTMVQSWLNLLRNVGSVRHFDTVRYPEHSTINFIIICVKILSCCSVLSYVINTMYLTSLRSHISVMCVSVSLNLLYLSRFICNACICLFLFNRLFQNISILICIFLRFEIFTIYIY